MTISAVSSGSSYSSTYYQEAVNLHHNQRSQSTFAEQPQNTTSPTSTSEGSSATTSHSTASHPPQAHYLDIKNGSPSIDTNMDISSHSIMYEQKPIDTNIKLDSGAAIAIIEKGIADTDNLKSYDINYTTQSGQDITISTTENVRIVENDDNSTSVYFAAENITRIYNTDGKSTLYSGNTLSKDENTLLINISSEKVTTGDGNDTVISLAEGAHISTSGGDDTVYIYGKNQSIDLSEGDNKAYISAKENITITAGDGNNTIEIPNILRNANITLGDGNNTLTENGSGTGIINSKVALGNGNNTIDISILQESSTMDIGNGDNNITMFSVNKSSTLNVGNGNNQINVAQVTHDSELTIGDGNNGIDVQRLNVNSDMTIGNGNNQTDVHLVNAGSDMSIGHGNNMINIHQITDSSVLSIGNGNNEIDVHQVAYTSNITTGNGNNQINAHQILDDKYQNSIVNFFMDTSGLVNSDDKTIISENMRGSSILVGNGNNNIDIHQLFDASTLNIGNGENTIDISSVLDNSHVHVGNGNNLLEVLLLGDESSLTAGDGHNTLKMNYLWGNSSVTMGDGNNDIYVLNILDESFVSLGDGNNILQIKNVENTKSIHLGSGENVGVIASGNEDDLAYIVGNTVYTQAELEEIAEEKRDVITNIIEKINIMRKERIDEELAIVANSALKLESFDKSLVNDEQEINVSTPQNTKGSQPVEDPLQEKSQPIYKRRVDTLGIENFHAPMFQNKAFTSQETSHVRGIY